MKFRMDRSVKSLLQVWEKQPGLAWTLSILWMVFLCAIAFLWNAGSIGLIDETEPLFAEAARQMTVTGDWITPYFNQATRFDKPPLVYWLMAIAYQTIGVNEWAVRLPSALAASVLTVFGFFTLKRFGFPTAIDAQDYETAEDGTQAASRVRSQLWLSAWIGAALIALNPQTIVWARTGVSDMLLSGCMGASLMAFFWGYASPPGSTAKRSWYLAFYALSALAVLAKGPVGIVIPGLIILAFLIYMGNLKAVLREGELLWGSVLFLLMAVPWYILVIQANGEAYINSFFGYHNIERFTSVVNDHEAPWFFYFLVVLLGFAPWSIHLPAAIARLQFWKRRDWQSQPRTAQLGIFALIWFAVIFIFFTIAVTKLPSYTIPLLPAAAMLLALLWSDQMTRERSSRPFWVSSLFNVGFLAILALAALYAPNWMGDDPSMPDLPQVVQRSGILLWAAGIWAVAFGVSLLLLVRRQGRWLWLSNLIAFTAFVIFTVMPASFIMDSQRQLPLRELAQMIVQSQQPGESVMMVGFPKPSLVFYTQQPLTYITSSSAAAERLRWLSQRNPSPETLLLVGTPRRIKETDLTPDEYQEIQRSGVYQLVRVNLTALKN